MSISPAPVRSELIRDGIYCLAGFQPGKAALVASWAPAASDVFWLAPKTYPPLTPAKVIAWTAEQGCPLLLYRAEEIEPLGYVELNPMPGEAHHLWIGHCIVDRARRGEGLGRVLVTLLLCYGFHYRRAQRISLVVFPDNFAAIHCYRACGFREVGTQSKYFYPTGRTHTMLQMSVEMLEWQAGQHHRL